MLIETLLHEHSGPHELTHVFKRRNVTFFKLHNESFCTAAGKIAHQTSHVYDSGFLHAIADEAHDEDTRNYMQAQMKDLQNETDLWHKHKASAMKVLLALAGQACIDKGPEVMMKILEEHLDIAPTELTMKSIIKRLEKE
jgi:hypothetical protein